MVSTLLLCLQVRDLLYSTVGLDTLGQPVNCLKTGHVLLRARAGPSYRLTAYMGSRQLPQQLSRTSDPSRWVGERMVSRLLHT